MVGYNKTGHGGPYEDFRPCSVIIKDSMSLEDACDLITGCAWGYIEPVSKGAPGWTIVNAWEESGDTYCTFRGPTPPRVIYAKIEGNIGLVGPW